ncbi:hypothetical protein BGZ58_006487 [Dissophora ornata]|nr:hypothetical protein BGZ58_006487 [Dissophora ornata]
MRTPSSLCYTSVYLHGYSLEIACGAAGCVVTARIAEDLNVKALVLVAGYTDEPLILRAPGLTFARFGPKDDWNLSATQQEHASGRSLLQPRGKMLGWPSAMNAMMYHLGPASDYDETLVPT